MQLDRRGFLRGAALTGLAVTGSALVGCSGSSANSSAVSDSGTVNGLTAESVSKKWAFEIAPEPILDSEIVKTVETEVVVVGGGPSGYISANVAAEAGAEVILFSSAEAPVSHGGEYFGIQTKATEAAGIGNYDIATVWKKRFRDNQYRINQDLWWTFARKNPEAINWLIDKMESAGYKTIFLDGVTDPQTGEELVYEGTHEWVGDDPSIAVTGKLVLQTLSDAAERNGVQVDFDTAAVQLVREDDNTGRVTAVIAENSEGYVKYVGSKGIILCTGDFTADSEMMAKYCPDFADLNNGGVYNGTGHKMALWIGAAWQKFVPNAVMAETLTGGIAAYDAHMAFTGLTINKLGKRYSNEDTIMAYAANAQIQQPDRTAIAIWDVSYAQNAAPWLSSWQRPSDPTLLPAAWDDAIENPFTVMGSPKQTTVKANTIVELATLIDVPADALGETVDKYNEACEAGIDDEFHKRKELLHPIAQPPFYAQYGEPWRLVVTGGLQANTKMQALDSEGDVIPGLYLAGTIVGDMYNCYDFIFGGVHLGVNCATFGYIAGEEIAR